MSTYIYIYTCIRTYILNNALYYTVLSLSLCLPMADSYRWFNCNTNHLGTHYKLKNILQPPNPHHDHIHGRRILSFSSMREFTRSSSSYSTMITCRSSMACFSIMNCNYSCSARLNCTSTGLPSAPAPHAGAVPGFDPGIHCHHAALSPIFSRHYPFPEELTQGFQASITHTCTCTNVHVKLLFPLQAQTWR